ncbi:hypothetical protein K8W59_03840 [Nocardioides rotundus]|uniref:hypothetical protein n=1 Tax=Nocardioides rotundus TaxID=1774216 RepID=UPI001CBB3F1C|nr:hypothetical protein [Nocardioides rotundus]UAL30658.1 hypothetical protein K8W59_03840 [Nocardioides rotundus]
MPQQTRYDDPRLIRARSLAADQGGVTGQRQLLRLGIPRWLIRAEVSAHRWQRISDQVVCLHNTELTPLGHAWAAVLQGGPRARLDGASALIAAGLKNFEVDRIRVSVPRGARVRRTRLYDIRQTRRWRAEDLHPGSGIPRARPAVAAVHAALWARSNRQADLLLTMPVQQGLVLPSDLAAQLLLVRRHRRRTALQETVLELVGGIRSLNELDVVRGCRARGIPEPDKQVLRRTPNGTYYLDLRWNDFGVSLEIDGIQHAWVENLVADALRHNAVALEGDLVLRLPVMGMRACPDAFFEQLELALVSRGWVRGTAA